MFEHRSQPLLPRRQFIRRALNYAIVSALLLLLSLYMGMLGYRYFAGVGWVDAFYNAAMILTGMGPALDLDAMAPGARDGVKVFAGLYALYSGVVFLAASGLVLTPLLHRFFHKLHFAFPPNNYSPKIALPKYVAASPSSSSMRSS